MNKIKVAFDCDGTLVDYYTGDPRWDMVALYHAFERAGCEMYIWSHAGEKHACDCKKKFGLKGKVVEKYSFKPDIAVDDEDRGIARVVIPA